MSSTQTFVGRREELSLLDALRAQLRAKRGGSVLIEGAPGVGKTALLEQFERRLADESEHGNAAQPQYSRGGELQIIRTSGTSGESLAPYSGLHILLQPFLDRLSDLPLPQRDALLTAFGMQRGTPPTPFLAGLATLTLLSNAASAGPLLVVVEDLHWIDAASRTALFIVARRVASEPILIVMTTRSRMPWSAGGIRRHELSPLNFVDANTVLDHRPDRPSGAVRRLLLELAGGNPLALVELTASEVLSGSPDVVPLTNRLERAFAGRFTELPRPTRLTILAAAFIGRVSSSEAVAAAAYVLGQPAEPGWLIPAIEAGLVERELTQVRFRHPLVRSAVTSACGPGERAMIVQALIETLDDPVRTVWLRSEFAMGPDSQLSDELDRLGHANLAADNPAHATIALRRAAELSADRTTSDDRIVRAADAARKSGAYDVADELLGRVEVVLDDPATRARALWIRAVLPIEGSPLLRGDFAPALRAVEALRLSGQTNAALDALLYVASSVWDHETDRHPGESLAAAAHGFDLDSHDPRMLLLTAVIDPAAHATEIIEHVRQLPMDDDTDPYQQWGLGYALDLSGDVELSVESLRRSVAGLRKRGNTDILPNAVMGLSWICFLNGEFAEGRALIDECITIADDLTHPGLAAAARVGRAWYDAVEGIVPNSAAIAEASGVSIDVLDARDHQATLVVAAGRAALATGHPRAAVDILLRLSDPDDPAYKLGFHINAFPDVVEACIAAGEHALAEAQVESVRNIASGWQSAVTDGALRFAEMMLVDDARLTAIAKQLIVDPLPVPLFDARAHLQLGTRLRRGRKIALSRRHLHRALEAFEAFPAPTWAARAREELRASGERLTDALPSGHHVLTPQELRTSMLAASGLSNREIAEQLFLSPRTVGAHLYSAFRKLGISGREQLADVLTSARPEHPVDTAS